MSPDEESEVMHSLLALWVDVILMIHLFFLWAVHKQLAGNDSGISFGITSDSAIDLLVKVCLMHITTVKFLNR